MSNLLDAISDMQHAQTFYNNNQRLATIFWVILAILFVVMVVVSVMIFVNGYKRQKRLESFFTDALSNLRALDRHCDFCGAVVQDDAKICPHCGASLKTENVNKNKP